MADTEPSCDPSSPYVLMEDLGRCMTMPHTCPPGSPLTRSFSASTAVEAEDSVPPLPNYSPNDPSQRSSPAAKTGSKSILRSSSSLDNESTTAPRTKRVKKHVSITLPGSSRPMIASRRRLRENAGSATADGTLRNASDDEPTTAEPDEVIVQVDVHEMTVVSEDEEEEEEEAESGDEEDEEEEEEGVHMTAVGLLNGGVTECNDRIQLRDRLPQKQGSQRKSMRQSLTSSLSRIGNRMRRRKPQLQRLQSTLDFDDLAQNELELKANLYWHIGTPIKRWKVEGQVPVKLILQLLKTLCLIVQVILFTRTIPHMRAEFFFDSRIVFESLFMVDFDPDEALQQRTLYTIQQVSKELEFIATNYYKLPDMVIGGYDHVLGEDGEPLPLEFRLRQYREADLNISESRFVLNGNIDEIYFNFSRASEGTVTEQLFNIARDRHFHKFIELRVQIPVNVIRIEAPEKAECYRFNVMIVFENDDNNGKFLYYLQTEYSRIDDCRGRIVRDTIRYDVVKGMLVVLDIIVLGFCLLSLFLTAKTLRRAYHLGKAMGHFYHHRLNLPLSWWERRSLFSSWHYINILSDLLITAGSIDKILLELEVVLDASVARILLGTALLFQAAVILRYINYFKQVNALTRTLALAFPELVKFLLCGSVLFFAFSLCGWIVLGPFHPKFTTFNDTIETLFSLLNGDDIYNTYILLTPGVDLAAYIYSRFFLYIFLGLFIYSVLNLFTSLIISAYEISQNKDTATGNEVRKFVFSGALTPRGAALRDVTSTSKYVDPSVILNKAKKKRKTSSSDDDQ